MWAISEYDISIAIASASVDPNAPPNHHVRRREDLEIFQFLRARAVAVSAASDIATTPTEATPSGRTGEDVCRALGTSTGVPLPGRKTISAETLFIHCAPFLTNAAGKKGLTAEVKILACLRVLGTARSFDDLDDGSRMASETLRGYFKQFCWCIQDLYGGSFLNRFPTKNELSDIAAVYGQNGFQGCIGCVDGCKMKWKNCPSALKGQYHNTKEGKLATIGIEAWCDRNLYIWHCIDLPNDYMLHQDGQTRRMGYFLVDGIYPRWTIFARPIHQPTREDESRYTKLQEALRKDIERAFGVLQARFQVLRRESFLWCKNDVVAVSETCVILHNMLVRMNEEGKFQSDAAEDGQGFNIVTELWDEEIARAQERDIEREEQHDAAEHVANEDGRIDLEALRIKESVLTSSIGFNALREELIIATVSGSSVA
eukprot:IDg2978t1